MAELANPYSCDVCGVVKGDNNHWWRVWRLIDRVEIAPWRHSPTGIHFHACGEEHALRLAAKLLGELNKENTEPTPAPGSADPNKAKRQDGPNEKET